MQLITFSSLIKKTLGSHKKTYNTRWNEKNIRSSGKTLGVAPLLRIRNRVLHSISATTGFSAKITRFTKKFTRSEKKSLDSKIFVSKVAVLLEMMYLFTLLPKNLHIVCRFVNIDHVEASDGVSRLGLGLETRFWSLGLKGFRSRPRALRLETLHRLFFMKFCKEFLRKTVDCSKFSRSKRSVAILSLLVCCLRDGETNLPSTPFKIYTEFNKKCACTNETA